MGRLQQLPAPGRADRRRPVDLPVLRGRLSGRYEEARIFVWRPNDGRAMDPTTHTARAINDRLGFTEIARRERDAIAAFEYERVTACQALMRPGAS